MTLTGTASPIEVIVTDPTFPREPAPPTPLQDLVEQVFEEEIKAGEAKALRPSGGDNTLLGFKGESVLDSGLIYAPYIPLQTTPGFAAPLKPTPLETLTEGVFEEEIKSGDAKPVRPRPKVDDDFSLRKGLRTRIVKINPDYFGTVQIENIE